MKKIKILIVLIGIASFLVSCQKGEIPGNDEKYIGVWKNIGGSINNSYVLTIHEDAKAQYSSSTMSGIVNKTYDISGYIYFSDDYNFRVGAKHIGKKFKVDQSPRRITVTVEPYVYYYVARFNGIDYQKDM